MHTISLKRSHRRFVPTLKLLRFSMYREEPWDTSFLNRAAKVLKLCQNMNSTKKIRLAKSRKSYHVHTGNYRKNRFFQCFRYIMKIQRWSDNLNIRINQTRPALSKYFISYMNDLSVGHFQIENCRIHKPGNTFLVMSQNQIFCW